LGLFDKLFQVSVQIVFTPASKSVTDSLEGRVGASRPCLLEIGTSFLELTTLVIEIISVTDECPC
jgi:hypothetical protein